MTQALGFDGAGFNFELSARNAMLEKEGTVKRTNLEKTGTTLAAMVFKGGVVLGADCRSTQENTVANKDTFKVHYIAPNIQSVGAGTSADTAQTAGMVSTALVLHRYNTGRESRVISAVTIMKNHLRRYGGHIGAHMLVGGVDLNGPQLYSVHPAGSAQAMPFGTSGSGGLAAMSVMESGYRDNMSKQEAMDLTARAIEAGIMNDLASGSNVDLVVITPEGQEVMRHYRKFCDKQYIRKTPLVYPPGTTPILKERRATLKDVTVVEGEAMDIS